MRGRFADAKESESNTESEDVRLTEGREPEGLSGVVSGDEMSITFLALSAVRAVLRGVGLPFPNPGVEKEGSVLCGFRSASLGMISHHR